ncbi:MFS transporter [bacterium]|nr:MFS transporter [bacterium]
MSKVIEEMRDYFHSLSLFSRNVRLFLAGTFFIGIGQSVFMLMFNLYLKEAGYAEGFIGSTLSISSLGQALFSIPLALIMAKMKLRKILLIIPFLLMLSFLALTFGTTKPVIMTASFFRGIFFAVIMVVGPPFFMRNSGEKERTHIFSISFALALASGILGNVMSGLLYGYAAKFVSLELHQYRVTLTVGSVIAFLAVLAFILLDTGSMDPEKDKNKKIVLKNFPLGFMAKIALPQLVVGLGAGLVIPFLNLYFRDVWELTPKQIAPIFGVSQAFMFVGISLGPVLKKHMGMVKAVVLTQLLSMPFMFILGFSRVFWLVVISFFLRATLMNMSQPLITNFTMENVSKEFQFTATAILSSAWTGAWVISSWLGGNIIEKYGFNIVFLSAIVFYFISSFLYIIFFLKSKRSKEYVGYTN